jgi:hypothetical protein
MAGRQASQSRVHGWCVSGPASNSLPVVMQLAACTSGAVCLAPHTVLCCVLCLCSVCSDYLICGCAQVWVARGARCQGHWRHTRTASGEPSRVMCKACKLAGQAASLMGHAPGTALHSRLRPQLWAGVASSGLAGGQRRTQLASA